MVKGASTRIPMRMLVVTVTPEWENEIVKAFPDCSE